MIRATTPTLRLTINSCTGDTVDLSLARNVYVTIQQGSKVINLSGDEVTYEGNVVSVFLSQENSLALNENEMVKIQVNWTYLAEDEQTILRAATNVGRIMISEQLLKQVLE